MLTKLLEAKADSVNAIAYYYDHVQWLSRERAEQARAAMDAAWLFVMRLKRLIAIRSADDEMIVTQRLEIPLSLKNIWATRCMVKERWRYTSNGLIVCGIS